VFEAAFEQGVLSTARPGTGVKFTGDAAALRGLQTTKASCGFACWIK
jgi:hypothetical protein